MEMLEAAQNFDYEERPSESPFVETVWRTQSEQSSTFISGAVSHWELVVWRENGKAHITVRGPETKATIASSPENAEFVGIRFKLGTFMPHLPTGRLVDEALVLPGATDRSFWLNDAALPLPDFEDADTFVARLVREGLLRHEPIVTAVLQNETREVSLRSVQRRFVQATGLTHGTIRQIERAREAATLLEQGTSIADAVFLMGYADQPHLTRSLKRFMGQTPAQIVHHLATK
jgi:AraC-like DNA-binding protein